MKARPAFNQMGKVKCMMTYFGYKHLPEHLQEKSKIFHDAASHIFESDPVDYNMAYSALELLVQAKDAYVRSFVKQEN